MRRILAVAGLAAALSVLSATSAHAVYQDDKVNCFTGTSGSVCSRFRWDASYYRAMAYGAKDPASGYWIRWDQLTLRCDLGTGNGAGNCGTVMTGPSQDIYAYDSTTAPFNGYTQQTGTCITYWSDWYHTTYGGSYLARTAESRKCRY